MVTGEVVTVNVAVAEPSGMLTLRGTCAVGVLVRVTVAPPAGAAPVNVTVPVDEPPPVTEVGFSVSALRTGAAEPTVTVSVALSVTPPYRAPKVAVVVEAGTWVPILKETLV
jgi:hypothetical protein